MWEDDIFETSLELYSETTSKYSNNKKQILNKNKTTNKKHLSWPWGIVYWTLSSSSALAM